MTNNNSSAVLSTTTKSLWILIAVTVLVTFLSGCGGGGSNNLSPTGDADGDGLTNAQEDSLGTSATNPDSDGDRIWDGEEVNMFGTIPTVADSDNDGMDDGADPQPMIPNPIPVDSTTGNPRQYAVFTDNAQGNARQRITDTHFEINHVVYASQSAVGSPFLIYQTYLADSNNDGKYDEGDLAASAIGIMNVDGARPRILTDLDLATGLVLDNGAVDATPEPSPDGRLIVFVSNRQNTSTFQLKLYTMEIDGSNPTALVYSPPSSGPDITAGEIDADPHWGPGNTLTFKRETLVPSPTDPRYSRVYTATIDTANMTISNVVLRTDEPDTVLVTTPGDFDPKISPDGSMITSYRHISDPTNPASPGDFGDYDFWVGQFSAPNQPATASITFLDVDPTTINLFPRWNLGSDKIAVWRSTPGLTPDPIDIVVFDLSVQMSPFSVTISNQVNITQGGGWIETMPSWNTDPSQPDTLIYSASR